jgi:LysM repeat protein
MKLTGFARALLAVSFLLILCFSVDAQVVVERSKEKIIISGVQYYIHPVKKGETAYSISKAYGITVAELTKDNPQASEGIKEGQSLRIQVKDLPAVVPSEVAAVPKSHDESKYLYHILKQGETVYFLSKTYNVTENEIVESNPGIDITKMSVGSEIAVPKSSNNTKIRKGDVQEKKYFLHKVAEGETLSSIAGKYGISSREIRRANRDVRIALVGDYIRIPGVRREEPPVTEAVKPDTIRPVVIETPPVYVAPGRTEVKNLGGTLNVALLLPFYLQENADRGSVDTSKTAIGNTSSDVNLREEEWIYPRSLDFVEMYEGILLAADTLRALGLNINIYPFDIKSDTFELTRLISSGKLSKMDLIIGPVYSHNLSIVAGYAGKLDIPVVSPVSLLNNSVLLGNPGLFLANSTLEVSQQALAKKASEYYDRNFVFIHSDSTNTDQDVIRLKNLIMSELGYKIPHSEIKFKEVIFSGLSMFDNDYGSRIAQALSDKTENIVIIATEDAPVISKTIVDLHTLSRRFDIKVFGYSEISENDNLDPKLFFDLGLMLYSPSHIDYSGSNVAKFNSHFREKFLTQPVEKSYAWQGYDIAYYFMSGLAMHGRGFINDPSVHNPVLLQTEYNFLRRQPGDGFENQKQYLIRYTKDYEVNVAEEYPGNNHKLP